MFKVNGKNRPKRGLPMLVGSVALATFLAITVPTGDLLDGVYDTLGNHYVIPQYCFSTPINLTTGSSPLKTSTALIPFEITLKPNIGPSITLAVTTHTTLLELKTQLHSFYSTQHRYLFFYMGQQLNLNQTLGDIQFINLPILQVMVVSPLSLDT
ncbi:hypothetical protein HMI55_000249 [Coelomomyces lativittatus]|nr:hypothetical protein HMI55_000249 [Coelomomyces lativittatus]